MKTTEPYYQTNEIAKKMFSALLNDCSELFVISMAQKNFPLARKWEINKGLEIAKDNVKNFYDHKRSLRIGA